MRKLVMIVGLPGSGKTHYAINRMAESSLPSFLIDDLDKNQHLIETAKSLSDDVMIYITDPKACLVNPKDIRKRLEDWFGECDIELIAFANDFNQCCRNVNARNDGRNISMMSIKQFSDRYKFHIDLYDKIIPVWEP